MEEKISYLRTVDGKIGKMIQIRSGEFVNETSAIKLSLIKRDH